MNHFIEGHYTVDGFYEAIDIDDAYEAFLEAAACHHNAILMEGPQPEVPQFEDLDDFPF